MIQVALSGRHDLRPGASLFDLSDLGLRAEAAREWAGLAFGRRVCALRMCYGDGWEPPRFMIYSCWPLWKRPKPVVCPSYSSFCHTLDVERFTWCEKCREVELE